MAKVCSVPGCPKVYTPTPGRPRSRCPEHEQQAERRRGSAHQRGYDDKHRDRFRLGVLTKHPTCVVCEVEPSTVADHWPKSKRELIALGLDDNDPRFGRGLCARCHNRETAQNQPGGWHTPGGRG